MKNEIKIKTIEIILRKYYEALEGNYFATAKACIKELIFLLKDIKEIEE